MKELLLSPLFLISSSLFFIHQFVEKFLNIHYVILDSYLDCLLFFPIILTLITLERRVLLKNKHYKLPLFEIVIITIFLSIMFEEVVPQYFTRFTKDYFDYIAYFSGTFLFYLINNYKKIPASS